jgi:low temperature requirement protein LtrA
LLLWLPWSKFAWSANAVAGNAREVRLLFLTATAANVPMAASISPAFDQGGVLLVLIDLILLVTLVVEHLRIERPRASAASVDNGRVVDDTAQ